MGINSDKNKLRKYIIICTKINLLLSLHGKKMIKMLYVPIIVKLVNNQIFKKIIFKNVMYVNQMMLIEI